ncbi:MAG: polysaccharide biosynthesis protein, partial [Flavobacteriaceae bacterium]|nr:polysaccharide biosynthesis protein [Flavobacteriaceae bacterium]
MLNRIKNALKFSLSGEDTRLDLRNIKYLPRWAVFLIDIFLVAFSTFLTILIIIDLTPNYYTLLDFPLKTLLIILVNTLFFLVFKTYAGIIRHSSNIDALKLMLATVCSFISLAFISYITYFVIGHKIFLIGGLLINLWISFSMLFLFR